MPLIQRGLGGNPAVPQCPPAATFTDAELAMKAFEMLEAGSSFVDVMDELKLDEKRMGDMLNRYGTMKAAEAKISMMGERYLEGWFKLARYIGEVKRDNCDQYSDETGVCTLFVTREVEKDFRNKYPGMLKIVDKHIRFYVMEHPETCALCDHRPGVA